MPLTEAARQAASLSLPKEPRPVRAASAVQEAPKEEDESASAAELDLLAVERALAGDRLAFEGIVARHERRLWRHLRRLAGSNEEAEDLVQETFLKAWRGLPNFRAEKGASLSAWLYRIATNEAMSSFRKRRPSAGLEEAGLVPDERAPSAISVAAGREMSDKLWKAAESLPPAAAAMFSLRYKEGLSVEEVAEAVGKKPGAVRVALHRAREKLREAVFGPNPEGKDDRP
jgi:RNA polymerase sigma-70 factor (ECF subfamily)